MKALKLLFTLALLATNALIHESVRAAEDDYYDTEFDEESSDESSKEKRTEEPSKRFEGGAISVKKSFDLKKAGSRTTHASKTFEMYTPDIDEKLAEAKKQMLQAHMQNPNSPEFLQAFGKMVNIYKDVPKCQLGVETGSRYVTFQQGREYNIKPDGDSANPNRFKIEVKFEDGGTRDAFLDCSPMMSDEDVIAALEAFGFAVTPGRSVELPKDKNMIEGVLIEESASESQKDEKPSYYRDNPIYDSSSGLYMGGSSSGRSSGGNGIYRSRGSTR